jgi:DNA polymerase III delta subunit
MSHWKNPPPVVVLSGTDSFLRTRELKEAVSVADQTGRQVEYVSASDEETLVSLVSGAGVLFKQKYLVVVQDPLSIAHDLVLRHFNRKSNRVSLVLHHEGTLPKKACGLSKVVSALPKNFVARFDSPKPWERENIAVEFVLREAKKVGVEISSEIASGMLSRSDSDLGVLSYEIQKLAWMLDSEKRESRKVSAEDVRGILASFSESGPLPIVESLEMRDGPGVARALYNMRRSHIGQLNSATLRACGYVTGAITNWLHVAALKEQGSSADEISQRVGIHSFVVKKTLIPASQRWGKETLVSLLKSLAAVERGAKSGAVNSWSAFEQAILSHTVKNNSHVPR